LPIPKAYVAIATVFAANHLANDALGDAVEKVVLLVGMIVMIHLAWLVAGALIAAMLRDPLQSRIVNLVLAVRAGGVFGHRADTHGA
jgi:threonine/homoserine/homoserine lactone efflux protein